jgi:hypothetical protein
LDTIGPETSLAGESTVIRLFDGETLPLQLMRGDVQGPPDPNRSVSLDFRVCIKNVCGVLGIATVVGVHEILRFRDVHRAGLFKRR